MEETLNHLGQAVGYPVDNWQTVAFPSSQPLQGAYCAVVPLNIEQHAADLFAANQLDTVGEMWTYLPYGPFQNLGEYRQLLEKLLLQQDQQFYVVVDNSSHKAIGVVAYLRINPNAGSIEVGHLSYSPLLQKSIMATEAMYLMMKKIFEIGYRRYEWKCNALNETSKSAAHRLGFQFEGIFRQAMVIDGRNRDTAWFSIIDSEWLFLKAAFESWLARSNFDGQGQQFKSLKEIQI